MRVTLCGGVSVDGVDGQLPAGRAAHLFGYLAAHRDAAVGREAVIDALWPSDPPRDPPAVLNSLVSRLRRVVGREAIAGGPSLRLVLPAGATVDVEEAEAALTRARTALAAGDHGAAREHAERARAIAGGGFMPGYEAQWIEERRGAVEALHLDALETVARVCLALGPEHAAEAERAARLAVARAPLRESGRACLMDVLDARGNVVEALGVYEELRTRLRDELGLVPGPELRELHERLLAGQEHEEPAAPDRRGHGRPQPPLPRTLDRPRTSAFVGRAAVLAALDAALAEARARGPLLALVSGEPGVGKSRVVAEHARAAHAAGAVVLHGRCTDQVALPFGPWREALGPLGRLPSGGDRERLFEAWVALLRAAGEDSVVVLVLDDLPSADPDSLAALAWVLHDARGLPLLVVATARRAELRGRVTELVDQLRRDDRCRDVRLGGLSADEMTGLVAQHAPGATPRLIAELRRRTAGNPLFAQELLRELAASGDESAVPETLRELLRTRIERLGERPARLLDLAAVIGEEVDVRLLASASGLVRAAVLRHLEPALGHRLLEPVPDEPMRYAFAHPIVRDALLESLSAGRRARLEAAVLEALGDVGSPAERAQHALAAVAVVGETVARAHARAAAEDALAACAYEDAAMVVERALATTSGDGSDAVGLLLLLGEARRRIGASAALAAFGRAFEMAAALGDGGLVARAALGLGSAGRGDFGWDVYGIVDRELVRRLRHALAALPTGDPLVPVVQARLAIELSWSPDRAEALELSARALADAARVRDPRDRARLEIARFFAIREPEQIEERMRVAEGTLAHARGRDDPLVEAAVIAHLVPLQLELGRVDDVRDAAARLDALAAQLRDRRFEAEALDAQAALAILEGRLDDGERLAHAAFRAAGEREPGRNSDLALAAHVARVRLEQDRVGELVPTFDHLSALHPEIDTLQAFAVYARVLAGAPDEARERFDRWVRPGDLDRVGLREGGPLLARSIAGLAAARLGDAVRAEEALGLLEPFADRHAATYGPVYYTPIPYVIGLIAAALGREPAAIHSLEQAIAAADAIGSPPAGGHARAELAALLARRGDGTRAATLLDEARRQRPAGLYWLERKLTAVAV